METLITHVIAKKNVPQRHGSVQLIPFQGPLQEQKCHHEMRLSFLLCSIMKCG